ncbi:peroxidase 64-like [Andrographis paniculata]|uniref:peroxidase 64-like n=1 Tax=Andrographis paniculata TaxID=175694 RepID=UPI0021E798D3|nr:peroxidase 64-like [Andrographis paniculata]
MAAVALIGFLIILTFLGISNALSVDYYEKTCPGAESAITRAVHKGMINDKTVPAALLRMHFHDCFIRGCDASVLLDSKGSNRAEKAGPPNISLHAFYVIDLAKKAVEKICPGVVSCADILALAARDAVALSGGPSWEVPKGRKDGRISKANDSLKLPFPTFNISQLQQSFSQRGLSIDDLLALSGGHTLGFSHCSSFQNRIHNFNSKTDVDPAINPSFAAGLRQVCPMHNKVKSAGANLDPTPTIFDNAYYRMLVGGKSILTSDQALLDSPRTKALAARFAASQEEFFKAFVHSMIKMSSINGAGTEVRLDCRAVNHNSSISKEGPAALAKADPQDDIPAAADPEIVQSDAAALEAESASAAAISVAPEIPAAKYNELEIANQLLDAFNALAESSGSKDKNPQKKRVMINDSISQTICSDKEQILEDDAPEEHTSEETKVIENSINFIATNKSWNRNEIVIDNAFVYNVTLDIMENDDDPEPTSVDKYRKGNDWLK